MHLQTYDDVPIWYADEECHSQAERARFLEEKSGAED